ncbi:MAG: prolyl oligopeptidase family serine peptidase [Nannocystis sp.]|nr:PHB depolymerase family esterase [Nannocystis sp.]MBA3547831.1 prolyl oligopeptidase family serine peptidase [Nannocystis sp.]
MRKTLLLAVALGTSACGGPDDAATSADSSSGSSSGAASSAAGEPTSTGSMTSASVTGTGSGEPETSTSTGAIVSTGADEPASTGEGESSTGEPIACAPAALAAGDHKIQVMHGGLKRTALVHIPASLDLKAPAPLVLNFHGLTSNSDQQVFFSGMNPKADAAGFIVVYPQGVQSSWNAGACCGAAIDQDIDDVGFVRALVAQLELTLCIDERRIYATGMSNGGFMSHRLACEAADLFAAVAPVSAVNGMDTCSPSRPVPVMMFNGTLDPLVAYNGGGLFGSAEQTFNEWSARDLCDDAPKPGKSNGAASCLQHDICDAEVSVVFCTFEGMGHCWPGNAFCPFGAASTDLSANDEMWAFFSQYTLP